MVSSSQRVLVADDSELDLQLTCRALAKALPGWEIDTVENGPDACSRIADQIFSLVLLDFKMPGFGAREILASLNGEVLARTPFLLFSSSVSPLDVARCCELGIREYVEKPMDTDAYERAVKGICARWAAKFSWE